MSAGADHRQGLRVAPDSELRLRLDVSRERPGWLRFALAPGGTETAVPPILELEALAAGESSLLRRERVGQGLAEFTDLRVDLAPYQGQSIELLLRSTSDAPWLVAQARLEAQEAFDTRLTRRVLLRVSPELLEGILEHADRTGEHAFDTLRSGTLVLPSGFAGDWRQGLSAILESSHGQTEWFLFSPRSREELLGACTSWDRYVERDGFAGSRPGPAPDPLWNEWLRSRPHADGFVVESQAQTDEGLLAFLSLVRGAGLGGAWERTLCLVVAPENHGAGEAAFLLHVPEPWSHAWPATRARSFQAPVPWQQLLEVFRQSDRTEPVPAMPPFWR